MAGRSDCAGCKAAQSRQSGGNPGGGNRTRTALRPVDFKSTASAISPRPAGSPILTGAPLRRYRVPTGATRFTDRWYPWLNALTRNATSPGLFVSCHAAALSP
jgi:hypothetical protein